MPYAEVHDNIWGERGMTDSYWEIVIDGKTENVDFSRPGFNRGSRTRFLIGTEKINNRGDFLTVLSIGGGSNVGFDQEIYSFEIENGYQTDTPTLYENSETQSLYEKVYFLAYDTENTSNRVNELNLGEIDSTSNQKDIVFADDGDGAGNDTVDAGKGDDLVFGRQGNDSLRGEEGNDVLIGGKGNDSLYGDYGDDVLHGGLEADILNGGYGNDTLEGGEGDDDLQGLQGNDSIFGEAGNDRLRGGAGDDTLDGGIGNDTFAGYTGNDSLIGGEGNDLIEGGSGNDTLLGDDGNDRLRGGDGDDILTGGGGNDILTGGDGEDTFSFRSYSDGIDTITDFNFSEGDKIEFNIMSPTTTPASQLFTYNSSTGALSFGERHFATLAAGLDFDIGRDMGIRYDF